MWYSVDFYVNFPWFWLISCYPGPGGQNDTDPTGSTSLLGGYGSTALYLWEDEEWDEEKEETVDESGQRLRSHVPVRILVVGLPLQSIIQ